jgi:hypothetical protein
MRIRPPIVGPTAQLLRCNQGIMYKKCNHATESSFLLLDRAKI